MTNPITDLERRMQQACDMGDIPLFTKLNAEFTLLKGGKVKIGNLYVRKKLKK